MNIIKCHICILDKDSCNQECVELEDVSVLYKEGKSTKDAIPDRFCTNHSCSHNTTGFKCELDKCVNGN